MAPLIDVHTHQPDPPEGVIAIRNLLDGFDRIPSEGRYSVGLHPWYLQPEYAIELPAQLITAAKAGNVLAIGECGLDTRCDTPADLQRRAFIAQVELAKQVNKPLIIHCVRAFDELLSILRKCQVSTPVIFHGFRQSVDLAGRILSKGYMLSFGRHLLNEQVAEVFRKLPADRVFLETDQAQICISEVYAAAAACLHTDVDQLAIDIESRFRHIFGSIVE
jgi:TatD DNase family protein